MKKKYKFGERIITTTIALSLFLSGVAGADDSKPKVGDIKYVEINNPSQYYTSTSGNITAEHGNSEIEGSVGTNTNYFDEETYYVGSDEEEFIVKILGRGDLEAIPSNNSTIQQYRQELYTSRQTLADLYEELSKTMKKSDSYSSTLSDILKGLNDIKEQIASGEKLTEIEELATKGIKNINLNDVLHNGEDIKELLTDQVPTMIRAQEPGTELSSFSNLLSLVSRLLGQDFSNTMFKLGQSEYYQNEVYEGKNTQIIQTGSTDNGFNFDTGDMMVLGNNSYALFGSSVANQWTVYENGTSTTVTKEDFENGNTTITLPADMSVTGNIYVALPSSSDPNYQIILDKTKELLEIVRSTTAGTSNKLIEEKSKELSKYTTVYAAYNKDAPDYIKYPGTSAASYRVDVEKDGSISTKTKTKGMTAERLNEDEETISTNGMTYIANELDLPTKVYASDYSNMERTITVSIPGLSGVTDLAFIDYGSQNTYTEDGRDNYQKTKEADRILKEKFTGISTDEIPNALKEAKKEIEKLGFNLEYAANINEQLELLANVHEESGSETYNLYVNKYDTGRYAGQFEGEATIEDESAIKAKVRNKLTPEVTITAEEWRDWKNYRNENSNYQSDYYSIGSWMGMGIFTDGVYSTTVGDTMSLQTSDWAAGLTGENQSIYDTEMNVLIGGSATTFAQSARELAYEGYIVDVDENGNLVGYNAEEYTKAINEVVEEQRGISGLTHETVSRHKTTDEIREDYIEYLKTHTEGNFNLSDFLSIINPISTSYVIDSNKNPLKPSTSIEHTTLNEIKEALNIVDIDVKDLKETKDTDITVIEESMIEKHIQKTKDQIEEDWEEITTRVVKIMERTMSEEELAKLYEQQDWWERLKILLLTDEGLTEEEKIKLQQRIKNIEEWQDNILSWLEKNDLIKDVDGLMEEEKIQAIIMFVEQYGFSTVETDTMHVEVITTVQVKNVTNKNLVTREHAGFKWQVTQGGSSHIVSGGETKSITLQVGINSLQAIERYREITEVSYYYDVTETYILQPMGWVIATRTSHGSAAGIDGSTADKNLVSMKKIYTPYKEQALPDSGTWEVEIEETPDTTQSIVGIGILTTLMNQYGAISTWINGTRVYQYDGSTEVGGVDLSQSYRIK